MADAHQKKEGQKHETKGNIQEKAGNLLYNDKLKAKGAANQVEGRAQYPREDAKGQATGAKDSLMGKTKEVVGGLTGNQGMKERGKAQEAHGDNKQDAHHGSS